MPSSMSFPACAKMPLSGAMKPTLIVSAARADAGAAVSISATASDASVSE